MSMLLAFFKSYKIIFTNKKNKLWIHYMKKVAILVLVSLGIDMTEMRVEFVLKKLFKGQIQVRLLSRFSNARITQRYKYNLQLTSEIEVYAVSVSLRMARARLFTY